MYGNFQNYIHFFRQMATHHQSPIDCQTSASPSPKLFVSEHFRLCKAKFQKRKFIQRQNKQQLGLYKMKMLRLVRKKSSQSVDEASKKIQSLEEKLQFQQDMDSIVTWIHNFQDKIKQWPIEKQHEIETLLLECKTIAMEIEARSNADQQIVSQVADKIQQICLECISQ